MSKNALIVWQQSTKHVREDRTVRLSESSPEEEVGCGHTPLNRLSLGDLPHPCGSGPLRAQAGGGPCGSREGLVWETARSRVQTWSPVLSVVKMIEARWTHIPAWETFCSSLSSHSRSRFVVLHLLTKLTEVKGIEEKFIPYTDQKLKSETQIVLEGLWQLQVKLGLNSSWFQPFI